MIAILLGAAVAGSSSPSGAQPGRQNSDRQDELFAPASDVTFTLSTERDSYSVQRKFVVTYRIVNVSHAAVYVPRGFEVAGCLQLGHMRPHVWPSLENSAGRHFKGGYGGSCPFTPGAEPTVRERVSQAAVLLQPGGHTDGVKRQGKLTPLRH